MAKATATCTCKQCGKTYTVTKNCYNAAEARSFEEWAVENCTLCSDCHRAEKKQEQEKAFQEIESKYNIPALTAKSEKQLAFAEAKRMEYAIENQSSLKKAAKLLKLTAPGSESRTALENEISAKGSTLDEYMQATIKAYELQKSIAILTETDAGNLLDTLLN